MINNYSYDINKITPMNDTSVVIQGSNKYNYNEIYGSGFTKEQATEKRGGHKSKVADIFNVTMGLNHHFKFEVPCLIINNAIYHKTYGKYLPIKSLSYKPVSVESTRIGFGIFSDFPIFHKRKMGSIAITMYDTNMNDYEYAVMRWFNYMTTDNVTGYIAPMADIVQSAEYTEYKNDGKMSKMYKFDVIPDGEVSLSRQYEQTGLKEISFNLLIVSPIQYCPDQV